MPRGAGKAGRRLYRRHTEPDRSVICLGHYWRRIHLRLAAPGHTRLAQVHAAIGIRPRFAPQRPSRRPADRRQLQFGTRRMVAFPGPRGELHGRGGAEVSRDGSAVGRREPGDSAKTDPLIVKLAGFFVTGFAINAVRVDLAVVNAAGFLGKAVANVVAIRLDLPPHLPQRRAELCGGHRREGLSRASQTRCHYRLLDRSVTATRAGDLTRLLLHLEPVSVTKPPLELMTVSAPQREQDHQHTS